MTTTGLRLLPWTTTTHTSLRTDRTTDRMSLLATQNVVVADASFSEQIADLATLFARAKPESEREAFRAALAVPNAEAAPATLEKLVATVATPTVAAPPEDAVTPRDTQGAYNLLVALIQTVFSTDVAKQTALLSSLIAAVPTAQQAGAPLQTQMYVPLRAIRLERCD